MSVVALIQRVSSPSASSKRVGRRVYRSKRVDHSKAMVRAGEAQWRNEYACQGIHDKLLVKNLHPTNLGGLRGRMAAHVPSQHTDLIVLLSQSIEFYLQQPVERIDIFAGATHRERSESAGSTPRMECAAADEAVRAERRYGAAISIRNWESGGRGRNRYVCRSEHRERSESAGRTPRTECAAADEAVPAERRYGAAISLRNWGSGGRGRNRYVCRSEHRERSESAGRAPRMECAAADQAVHAVRRYGAAIQVRNWESGGRGRNRYVCRSEHRERSVSAGSTPRMECAAADEAVRAERRYRAAISVRNWEVVAGDGIEPPTRGFSIPCSTN